MNIFLILVAPLLVIAASIVPLILMFSSKKFKPSVKKLFSSHFVIFFGVLVIETIAFFSTGCVHALDKISQVLTVHNNFAEAMKYISAALATGIASIGAGIAVASSAPAAIGAYSENPKNFGKAMVFVVLGEGIAIYGFVISFLMLLQK